MKLYFKFWIIKDKISSISLGMSLQTWAPPHENDPPKNRKILTRFGQSQVIAVLRFSVFSQFCSRKNDFAMLCQKRYSQLIGLDFSTLNSPDWLFIQGQCGMKSYVCYNQGFDFCAHQNGFKCHLNITGPRHYMTWKIERQCFLEKTGFAKSMQMIYTLFYKNNFMRTPA